MPRMRSAQSTGRSTRRRRTGAGVPQMLVALGFARGKPREIVLSGPRNEAILTAIRRHFLPGSVILGANEVSRPMPAIDGRSTVYVCENYACRLPVSDPESLEQQLVQ